MNPSEVVELYGPDANGPHPMDDVIARWLAARVEWLIVYDDAAPELELVRHLAAAGTPGAAEALETDTAREYAIEAVQDSYEDAVYKAWLYDRAAEMGAVPRFSELRNLLRTRA